MIQEHFLNVIIIFQLHCSSFGTNSIFKKSLIVFEIVAAASNYFMINLDFFHLLFNQQNQIRAKNKPQFSEAQTFISKLLDLFNHQSKDPGSPIYDLKQKNQQNLTFKKLKPADLGLF